MDNTEIIELMWLKLNGFNYIVRNQIGSVNAFVNKPHRNFGLGYATWVENEYPMTREEMKRRKNIELGKYDFIEWDNEPILISALIDKYQIIINN